MCVKCGGCPAYDKLLTCLFCEDGTPCPCGGWQKAQHQAAAQQPRRKKGKRAPRERELAGGGPRTSRFSKKAAPAPAPKMRGQRGHRTESPDHNAMDSAAAPSLAPGLACVSGPPAPPSPEIVPAPEVRMPVRFDGDFLSRRMRDFYGSRA